jgi:hypothetical protein
LVDLLLGHELIDVDRALALDCDSFKLLGIKLDVVAFANLIALDNVCRIDLISGLRIDLAVLDAMPCILIELMEADLLAFRCGRKQRNRTGNERQLEVAFPVRTRELSPNLGDGRDQAAAA